jgi:hypothetical protein
MAQQSHANVSGAASSELNLMKERRCNLCLERSPVLDSDTSGSAVILPQSAASTHEALTSRDGSQRAYSDTHSRARF